MDIHGYIHINSTDMDMDMDRIFHLHGKPADMISILGDYVIVGTVNTNVPLITHVARIKILFK